MAYPKKDPCFKNFEIDVVKDHGDHWYIASCDGQHYARYSKAAGRPIPKKGMAARVYGRGGGDERGLFVSNHKIAYRSLEGHQEWIKHSFKKNPLRLVENKPTS